MSSEVLDKLYLKFISNNRQVSHHPIIDLFLIRTDKNFFTKISEDSIEYQVFSKLPLLDSSQLHELHKNLLEKSLTEAFKGEYEAIFKFNSDFFQRIFLLREENKNNESGVLVYLLVSFFYCWLEFILDSSNNPQSLSYNSMDLFIREIENYGGLTFPFSSIESFLFSSFIENFIKCKSFYFDNESIQIISHHIKIDETLDHDFSPVFLQLIQKVSDDVNSNSNKEKLKRNRVTIEGSNDLLKTLGMIIDYKRKSLSFPDYQKLTVILAPFIENLNINAINCISNLSNIISDPSMKSEKEKNLPGLKNSFILLPPLFLKKLQRESEPFISTRDFFHVEERIYKIELSENESTDEIQWFISNNQYALENGFHPISVDSNIPLNDLLPSEYSQFLLSFSNSLKKANGLCIDNFFMAMFKLLDALENSNPHYYELYLTSLFLATTCVDKISLMSLFEMFNKKTIFYPELTIFDNKIPNEDRCDSIVRTIRFHVLNLFASQMEQLIPDFLKDAIQYPFLFAEELAFVSCMNLMNLEVFITKDFVRNIFSVIRSLINDYFKLCNCSLEKEKENQKERIFIALQTILSFLFKLLENTNIEMQYFSSKYFISNFFSLVFVDFLKPFILMTMSDFLLNLDPDYSKNYLIIDRITSYFDHLFTKLNNINFVDENDKNYKISLIIDISNFLLTALSMNMKLAKFFSKVLDSFLELKLNFHELLPLGLRFLSLVSMNSSDSINKRNNDNINCIDETKLTSKQLRLVINLIKKIEGNEPSQATKLSLMNLCAASMSLGIDSLFLILRPSMIPLLFIAYGESVSDNTKLIDILNLFNDICDFSESNCLAVHKSGIDIVLLEFVYNFLIKQTNSVSFRGIEFKLNFNKSDIFDSIFPFLFKIFTISVNNVDISLLNNLICSFQNPDLCAKVASFVLKLLLNQKTKVSPVFPLGFKQSPITVTKISRNIINKSFSFVTWIKIDHPVALELSQSIPIVTITDKLPNRKTNNNVFTLFINHGCLYYQFNNHIETIHQQIPSNTWFFIGFVCQRTTQQMSCIGLFTELSMYFCEDVPAVFFPYESPLTMSIGGPFQLDDLDTETDKVNKLAVLMGPFALFNKMLDDTFYENIEKQGPSAVEDFLLEDQNIVLRTINPNLNLKQNSIISISDEYKSTIDFETKSIPFYSYLIQNSFEKYFCANEQNLVKLMEVFIHYEEVPEDLFGLILAIMKQVFDASSESQQNFSSYFGILKHYLMKHVKYNSTFKLYKSFYSIFEVMRNHEAANQMFDNLLVNVELYSKGPPLSFKRIVKHWGSNLISQFPSLFTRKNFFNRLVRMYVYLFNKKPFDERYDEEKIDKIRLSFRILLEESSKLGLTKENILYFENFINIQTDNEKNLFAFLSILGRNISKIQSNDDYQSTLHHFAENENDEISQLAIILIHETTKPNWMKPMMALTLQLKAKINKSKNNANVKNSLIKFLLNNASKYPGFIHLISALTTTFDNEEKRKVSDKLKDIYCFSTDSSSQQIKDIVKDRYWYIWILIAAIHSEDLVQLSFLTIISSFLTYVDDLYSEINKIVNVLQIFEAVDKTFDYYQIVLDLFINVNAVNISYSKLLIIPLFRALFFKFNDASYSNGIINTFINGPFKNEYLNFVKYSNITFNSYNDTNHHQKYDILSLEPLLVQDYNDYKLNFAYDTNAGNQNDEGKLGHFLIQLVDSCSEVQFNKPSSNLLTIKNNHNNNQPNLSLNNILNNMNSSSSSNANDDAPVVQTANDVTNLISLFNGGILMEFVHFMVGNDKNNLESMAYFNNNLPKIQKMFNSYFLNPIFNSLNEIKSIIKEIKELVFVDFDSVKQNSLEIIKNSEFVSQFAKKVASSETKKFASNFVKYSNYSKRVQCRQSNSSLVYCPLKMEIEPERLEIDEFITKNKRSNNKKQETSFKANLHEFETEKEIEFVIKQNESIKLFENIIVNQTSNDETSFIHSLIKTISFNKIDFIITREKSGLEIFTSQQGSFYVEFLNYEDFVKCSLNLSSFFSPLNKYINDTQQNQSKNSKILTSILTEMNSAKIQSSSNSQTLTNFEYLMMLNYFSGYSFHKSGKLPRIPLNGQLLSASRFFLPEYFISKIAASNESGNIDSSCADPHYVCGIRHQLEEIDVQPIAKKKFKTFVPKTLQINFSNEDPITMKCHRDLTLEQGTIIAGGFIKSSQIEIFDDSNENVRFFKTLLLLYIVTKDGRIHFVEILRNKLKLLKSFVSDFLKENIVTNSNSANNCVSVVNSGDGLLVICDKRVQRFTPSSESPILETAIEPPLVSISGNDIIFVTNGCDVKKCNKHRVGNISLASSSSASIASPVYNTNLSNAKSNANNNLSSVSSSSSLNSSGALTSPPASPKRRNSSFNDQRVFDVISTSNSKITCVTSSTKFNIIVYGTEKCQLFVFSMGTEKSLHSVIEIRDQSVMDNSSPCCRYVGSEPQNVLITSGWGFIVTESQSKIFVHTINGTLVGYLEIENSIVDWCSASNSRGEDFVIFIDTSSQIGIFEAAKLDANGGNIRFIEGQPGTITITYYNEFECIVTLSRKDGVLTFFPMPLDSFT